MKLRNISIIFICLIVPAHILIAQSNIIVKIGNIELTKEEFRLRYELSPRILSNNLDNADSLKLKFLYSLVAEKLWATEALDKGLANSEKFKFYFTPIEKMYVRDELFRIEVKDKVEITNFDISKGLRKYVKILQVVILSSVDSSEIYNLYSQLSDVGAIDSLLKINPDIIPQSSVEEIKFGDLSDETLEDKLYQLNIEEFTPPIQNDNNWFIFQLTATKSNIPEVSHEKLLRDIEKIIRDRKTQNLYNEFYKKHFSGYTLEADKETFLKISEKLYNVITSEPYFEEDSSQKYFLAETDILKVKELLGIDFLNRELFLSKYSSVKVYDFLSDLTIVDVSFNEINQQVVNKVLSNELKRFMQQETVYRIGRQMGLEYSSEVRTHLEMWRDKMLAQILKNSHNSQIDVSENEIIQFYNEAISDSSFYLQLNVHSISTHNIEQMEGIINLLEDGNKFEQVLSETSIKEDIYEEEISDFKGLKDFGDVTDIVTELEVGEIFGPIKTKKGYTIFKVNETPQIGDSLMLGLKGKKEQIHQRLFFDKLNKVLENKTIELANKYGLEISEDFIYSESFSDVNMFVHRFMGFGGRIAAVPFTTPFYTWYYLWKIHSKLSP
jgi:hypothetical protein